MWKKFILALSMFVLIIRLQSQPYAVDALLQMRPPFSPYLAELTTRFPPALDLQLRLQDQGELSYPVQLRFSIQGEGISIKTREDYVPPPIFLDYGVPSLLSAIDLADYFQLEHLAILGLDQADFLQTGGRLPEGVYNICVEVLDQVRTQGAPISNQACSLITLAELPAPLITYPSDHQRLSSNNALLFQWTAQHLGAFPVDYKFQLFEYKEELSLAQNLSFSPPIFETHITNATSLLYDADEPLLQEGKSYLIQVQIQDISGQHHFQNEGKSSIHSFTYGGAPPPICALVSPSPYTHSVDSQAFECRWPGVQEAQKYQIELSIDSHFVQDIPTYQTHSVTDTFFRFSDLSVNTSYFYRIRAVVGECFSPYSMAQVVLTTERCQSKAADLLVYSCGSDLEGESQAAAAPMVQYLAKGDSIWASDFPIILTEVHGKGVFSGRGYVEVPYFQEARINVNFKQITVDQNCQLREGILDANGIGLQLLNEDQITLLTDLLAGLETASDILAAGETLLAGIDQIIAKAEPYLPDSILTNLLTAQAQFQQAEAVYAVAVDEGDSNSIATAAAELEAAKAALAEYLQAYKKALLQFFDQLLEVFKVLLQDLFKDCVMDQLSLAYTEALETLQAFVAAENRTAINTLPANSPTTSLSFQEYEMVISEEGQLMDAEPFDDLSNTYYEQEMSYLLCLTFQSLEEEIDTPAEVQDLQALFTEMSAQSFILLGEAIKAGSTTAVIVSQVKQQMNQELSQLIRQANYPELFTLSN